MSIVDDRRSGFDTRAQDIAELQGERREETDRRSQRRRVIKGVRISFNNEYCAVEGVMKNISDTGAFIKMKDGFLVPDEVMIHNDLEGYKVPAEVVRRQTDQIGVRFTGPAVRIEQSRTQVVNMINTHDSFAAARPTEAPGHGASISNPRVNTAPKKPVFGKRGAS